jgi:voltage-gated potassium channel
MSLRENLNTFVERHEVAWELAMAGLALVWVALGFLIDEVGSGVRPGLEATELVITAVFIGEFATRLLAAHARRQYLRGHWIDAVALAPPIRGLRVLRLLRLLRLVRAFEGVFRAGMHLNRLAQHRGLAWLLVTWLCVVVVCSAFVYVAEHGANRLMESPFDALWWGVSTITTVGYGDTYPVTPEGRLGAMVLMILGIGLFSAVTGTITSYFIAMERGDGSPGGASVIEQLERLANLHSDGSLTDDEFALAKAQLLAASRASAEASAMPT